MKIRAATPDDAASLLQIYAPLVEQTAISFELTAPTAEEFAERISAYGKSHAWLVAEDSGQLVGYSYGTPHRPRQAYRQSVETSVYVAQHCRGAGIGKRLYAELFRQLGPLGFHNAYAGIALPNDSSIALHKTAGFDHIGVFREVGYKLNAWHDVSWWQRSIAP